jgi:two-component system sensor histidine kinase/response regulator
MDCQMPEMDGFQATAAFRRREGAGARRLPIVAMTAHAMAGDREKSLAAGMNEHITKPIDQTVLYQTLKYWIAEKQSGTIPAVASGTASVSTADALSLPDLPGINQAEALQALNQNKKLMVKMLHDFKRYYSSFPDSLRALSMAGQWQEIQEKAHTIKGVSGYIGSSHLMKAAQNLEDALRGDQRDDAANYLVAFINALDEILSTLSILPSLQEEKPAQVQQSSGKANWGREVEKQVQMLIEQLKKGEAAAEEQYIEVRKLLAGTGLDKQLETIADLIDDIEYDSAADKTGILLKRIQKQLEK